MAKRYRTVKKTTVDRGTERALVSALSDCQGQVFSPATEDSICPDIAVVSKEIEEKASAEIAEIEAVVAEFEEEFGKDEGKACLEWWREYWARRKSKGV